MLQLKITFGKNSDGTKPVYLHDKISKQKMFMFHYEPITDNPYELKPKEAVISMINKAEYHDLADYWNHNQNKIIK
jgi:hypothetical protein